MKLKPVLLLALLLMIAIGCSNAKSEGPHSNGSTAKAAHNFSGLVPSVSIKQEGDLIRIKFFVKNTSNQTLPLQFNTTQHFDYVITDRSGKKVKQYSEGLMFGQIVTRPELAKGKQFDYEDEIKGLSPGTYTLTIWLTDTTYKPKLSQTFTVQ